MKIQLDPWNIDSIETIQSKSLFGNQYRITICNNSTGELRQIERSEKWMLNRIWGKFKSF